MSNKVFLGPTVSQRLPNVSGEKKTVLNSTVEDFYASALAKYDTNIEGIESFFFKIIHGCNVEAVLKDFDEWKDFKGFNRKGDWLKAMKRLVAANFQIKGTALSHTYDLDSFSKRRDELFD